MFSLLRSRFKKSAVVGLDIQSQEIGMLHLVHSKNGVEPKSFASHPLPVGSVVNGKIIDAKSVTDIVKKLVAELNVENHIAALALPGHFVFSQELQFATEITDEEREAEIISRLSQQLQCDSDEVFFDYQLKNENETLKWFWVVAAKREIIESYVGVANAAGLNTKIIEIDWCALMRAVKFCMPDLELETGIIEQKSHVVNLYLFQQEQLVFFQQINIDSENPIDCQPYKRIIQNGLTSSSTLQIQKYYFKGDFHQKNKIILELSEYFNTSVEIVPSFKNMTSESLVSLGLALRAVSSQTTNLS